MSDSLRPDAPLADLDREALIAGLRKAVGADGWHSVRRRPMGGLGVGERGAQGSMAGRTGDRVREFARQHLARLSARHLRRVGRVERHSCADAVRLRRGDLVRGCRWKPERVGGVRQQRGAAGPGPGRPRYTFHFGSWSGVVRQHRVEDEGGFDARPCTPRPRRCAASASTTSTKRADALTISSASPSPAA